MQIQELPVGVLIRPLKLHKDQRGELREMYRAAWTPSDAFLQWNLVRSDGGPIHSLIADC